MKLLYFDCSAGLSGDMILGALVDLGLDLNWLIEQLRSLPLENISIVPHHVIRGAISGINLSIEIPDHLQHRGRKLKDFIELLEHSSLSPTIREQAMAIFTKIAQAEAKIHQQDLHNIHFHELGSLDSVIDIVGTLLGIQFLEIEQIVSSPLHLGTGFTTTAHGLIPLPAPATLELITNIPVYSTGLPHELVTPTGAALIASLASDFGPLPRCRILKVGYGAGTRDLEQIPNLLRLILGTTTPAPAPDWHLEKVVIIETDIDDLNPEYYDHLIKKLFSIGALDVSLIPIMMKKNRPATRVAVISPPSLVDDLSLVIFQETSTLGLRYSEVWRKVLLREILIVQTSGGPVRVKIGKLDGKIITRSPEYEDCQRIAQQTSQPLKTIYLEAIQALSSSPLE